LRRTQAQFATKAEVDAAIATTKEEMPAEMGAMQANVLARFDAEIATTKEEMRADMGAMQVQITENSRTAHAAYALAQSAQHLGQSAFDLIGAHARNYETADEFLRDALLYFQLQFHEVYAHVQLVADYVNRGLAELGAAVQDLNEQKASLVATVEADFEAAKRDIMGVCQDGMTTGILVQQLSDKVDALKVFIGGTGIEMQEHGCVVPIEVL